MPHSPGVQGDGCGDPEVVGGEERRVGRGSPVECQLGVEHLDGIVHEHVVDHASSFRPRMKWRRPGLRRILPVGEGMSGTESLAEHAEGRRGRPGVEVAHQDLRDVVSPGHVIHEQAGLSVTCHRVSSGEVGVVDLEVLAIGKPYPNPVRHSVLAMEVQ